jgi:hypothetical protein
MNRIFGNLGLRVKLAIGFGVVLLCLGIVGICAIVSLEGLRDRIHKVTEGSLAGVAQLNKFSYNASMARTVQFRLAGVKRSMISKVLPRETGAVQLADDALAGYEKTAKDPVDVKNAAAVRAAWEHYKSVWNESEPTVLSKDQTAGFLLVDYNLGNIFRDELRPPLTAIGDWNIQQAKDNVKAGDAASAASIRTVVILAVFAVFLCEQHHPTHRRRGLAPREAQRREHDRA